jgi:large subunit ribosomal protein L5
MANNQTTKEPTLLSMYRKDITPKMIEEFGYSSPMQVPKLQKVVFNVGVGESLTNSNAIESVVRMISTISGQKPVVTKAKNSLAGFKIREGMSIGVMATLRSKRMYEFVDRLINVALPRIRDFRGIPSKSFDGRGNYSLGINEQVIFPEIDYAQIDRLRSFQVTVVTSANSDREAFRMLQLMGFPFVQDQNRQN